MDLAASDPADLEYANAARMYDYLLGGGHNFAVDRDQVQRLLQASPDARTAARANRAFLRRVVLWCLERGIDQFLDLGSGIPTVGNVHEILARRRPDARAVYVDIEPVAVAHASDILADNPRASVVRADLRAADAVLSAPAVVDLLDLGRPVAVLAVAVLHFIEEDAEDIVNRYRRALAPGGVVAISHLSDDFPEQPDVVLRARAGRAVYADSASPLVFRDREQLVRVMRGLDLVPPGLVDINDWPETGTTDGAAGIYGAVGVMR